MSLIGAQKSNNLYSNTPPNANSSRGPTPSASLNSLTSSSSSNDLISAFDPLGGGTKKFDLTKWKYADLRDTINTSCGERNSLDIFFKLEIV